MATGSTRYRPDWSSGGITAPSVEDVLLDYADRMAKQQNAGLDRAMREQQVAEEQRRWDIANARAQRKEDRELAEQTASDTYYKEILKGTQAVGGILNRESVINQASNYDFTPEEIAFSNANKINTPEQARKLGNEVLAKKIEGQLDLSRSIDTMYDQGVLNETRPEMYERALGAVTNKGLPVSKDLVASLDAARLAEQTAIDAKLKENREVEAKLTKDQRDDLWKVVNARTGGNTFTDAEGNTVTLPSLQREIKSENKADVSGVNTVQEAINKLGFDKPEKKEAAIKQSNEYIKLLEARGVPTDAAANIVASELSKKESNPWLSYVGFSNIDPKFDTKSINTYADMVAERYNKLPTTGTTSSSRSLGSTDTYPSKFELATKLADSNAITTANELARLRAEREALLGTSSDRRGNRIDEFIRPKEQLANSSTEGTSNKDTTVADRNNNPGNLTGNDAWEGKIGMDGRFVKFQSYEMGSRALAKNLIKGATGKTIQDYMEKYAPKSENDTDAYISNVSKALGKKPEDVITSKDIFPLMKVIAKQEGGKVDEAKLKAGYELATVLTGGKPFNTPDISTNQAQVDTSTNSIINQFNKLESTDLAIKDTKDTNFKLSNMIGFGGKRYSQKDQADFASDIRKHSKDVRALLTPENLNTVDKSIEESSSKIFELTNKILPLQEQLETYISKARAGQVMDPNTIKDVSSKLNEYKKLLGTEQNTFDTLSSSYNRMLDAVQDKGITASANKAKIELKEHLRKAYDPTVAEAVSEVGLTAITSIPAGKIAGTIAGNLATKFGTSFLKAKPIISSGSTPVTKNVFDYSTRSNLPAVSEKAARTIKEEGVFVDNASIIRKLGEIFSRPNIKNDLASKAELDTLMQKYPQFAPHIAEQYNKLF